MESDDYIDYMSQDFIAKAEEFDREFKIQKEILKFKNDTLKDESSDEEIQVNR